MSEIKTLLCGCRFDGYEFTGCSEHPASEAKTIYLNPTTDEVWLWLRSSRCAFCGGKCGSDKCRARYCDSCSMVYLADTEADLCDGRLPTVDCPPCVKWWANLHLENPPVGAFIHNIRGE